MFPPLPFRAQISLLRPGDPKIQGLHTPPSCRWFIHLDPSSALYLRKTGRKEQFQRMRLRRDPPGPADLIETDGFVRADDLHRFRSVRWRDVEIGTLPSLPRPQLETLPILVTGRHQDLNLIVGLDIDDGKIEGR